jgi:hypothetical protein
VIVIGSFMVAAWHSHSEWLWVTFPGMFYMKYNTSLAFIAGGAGLVAALRGERTYTIAAGGVVLVIGGLTLVQYVGGVNLGFDEFMLRDYWFPENPLRGRMAPSAALALTCVGAAQILLAANGRRTFSHILAMEVLSFVVLAVGMTAMVGYLAQAGFAYSWGSSARVAKEAAIGFTALGVGLVALTWQYQSISIARVPLWIPALMCFGYVLKSAPDQQIIEAVGALARHHPFCSSAVSQTLLFDLTMRAPDDSNGVHLTTRERGSCG